MTPTCRVGLAALAAAWASAALGAGPVVTGDWETSVGRIRVVARGELFVGTLVAPGACSFEPGSEVMKGTLLDDSFAGKLRVCLRGRGCKSKEEWASAVFLVGADSLAGAVHVESKGCAAPVGKKGGLTLKRPVGPAPPIPGALAVAPSAPPKPPAKDAGKTARRAKARELLRDGAAYLNEGSFEAARRRFLESIDVDDGLPEAFNGVGVTWRMRNDLDRALEWYKKALAVDPDFGDAYYNMACVYALRGEKEMALRYLQIAALNGYASAEGIDEDPDLEKLRDDPAYKALVRARM